MLPWFCFVFVLAVLLLLFCFPFKFLADITVAMEIILGFVHDVELYKGKEKAQPLSA